MPLLISIFEIVPPKESDAKIEYVTVSPKSIVSSWVVIMLGKALKGSNEEK